MILTAPQRATFKAAIEAAQAVGQPLAGVTDEATIAAFYNADSTFIVWRTKVTQDEIMLNGFDWARVDNLSIGKARIWEWMFDNANKAIDPSKTNIRAGIDAAWVGTAPDLAVRAAVYVHCKRPANRGEALFTTGTGTTATPGFLVAEGTVNVQQISDIIGGL